MLLSLCNLSAQRKGKDYSNILRSNNIYEIDSYLRIAHPDDPKRSVLKPRLVKLLNEYIKTAHPADQRVKDFQEKLALLRRKPSTRISFGDMNENIREKQIAKYREESAKKPSCKKPVPSMITKPANIKAGLTAACWRWCATAAASKPVSNAYPMSKKRANCAP